MSEDHHATADTNVFLVLSTFGDHASAETCAQYLVKHRHAACVQIDGPIRSVYQWKGEIEADDEFRLLVKTSSQALDECVATLQKQHPYDLPEIVVLNASASTAYASWVTEQTSTRE
ncbi:divalent-cation tolerance protein CutA [Pirellulales bacterium]|nr:divalent-cation tolerance protein CutA [Pirellulales bacterium]